MCVCVCVCVCACARVCVCVRLWVEDTGPPALVKANSNMYKDRNSDTHTQRYGKGIYINAYFTYIHVHIEMFIMLRSGFV